MCGRVYFIPLVHLVLFFISNVQSTKSWIGNNLEFMDSKMWEGGNSPCALDKILFPEQYSAALFIPQSLEINGFMLPKNGVLLTSSNMNISFSEEERPNRKCKNRNHFAKIKEVTKNFWFNPENWKTDSNAPQNEAIPHVERIPCSSEKVIVDHHAALSIDLEDAEDLYIGNLIIDGRETSASILKSFLKSEAGRFMFPNAGEIQVRYFGESTCGCHRPETAAEVHARVCTYKSKSCEIPHCINPITPTGHCCALCGSVLKMYVDNCRGFNLELFRKQVKNVISTQNMQNDLDFYAGMVDEGIEKYLQLIIIDKNGYNEKSTEFMNILNDTFVKKTYPNMKLIFHSSGLPFIPGAGVSGWVFVLVTLLIVVIFFVAVYAHYIPENPYISLPAWVYPSRYPATNSPFVFARFENAPVEVETTARGNVIMNVTYEEEGAAQTESTTTSFDNPMFSDNSEKTEVGQDATEVEEQMTTITLDSSVAGSSSEK